MGPTQWSRAIAEPPSSESRARNHGRERRRDSRVTSEYSLLAPREISQLLKSLTQRAVFRDGERRAHLSLSSLKARERFERDSIRDSREIRDSRFKIREIRETSHCGVCPRVFSRTGSAFGLCAARFGRRRVFWRATDCATRSNDRLRPSTCLTHAQSSNGIPTDSGRGNPEHGGTLQVSSTRV